MDTILWIGVTITILLIILFIGAIIIGAAARARRAATQRKDLHGAPLPKQEWGKRKWLH